MRLNPLSDKYCRNTRSFFLVLPPLHLSLVRLIYSMPQKNSDEGNIPNIIREKEQRTEKSRITLLKGMPLLHSSTKKKRDEAGE